MMLEPSPPAAPVADDDAEGLRQPLRWSVRIVLTLMLLIAGSLLLGVIAWVPPADSPYYPKCMSYTLLGWHCPGCGTTRALHAALNGDFRQALAFNLFAPVLIPLVAYELLANFLRAIWQRREPFSSFSHWKQRALWLLLGVMMVYGVLRNLPREPFTQLAPHERRSAPRP